MRMVFTMAADGYPVSQTVATLHTINSGGMDREAITISVGHDNFANCPHTKDLNNMLVIRL